MKNLLLLSSALIFCVLSSPSSMAMDPGAAIASGRNHTCAVTDQGTLCWGDNSVGQLQAPRDLIQPRLVSVGVTVSCAAHRDGVTCWGDGSWGQTQVPAQVKQPDVLAAGHRHVCALERGKVYCWGRNDWGETSIPERVQRSSVKSIAIGDHHSCALMEEGVDCWGVTTMGYLNVPAELANNGSQVKSLVAGYAGTCAILVNHDLKCWGYSFDSPHYKKGLPTFKKIQSLAIDSNFVCGRDEDGIRCNFGGYSPINIPAKDLADANDIHVTLGGVCTIDQSTLRCWGEVNRWLKTSVHNPTAVSGRGSHLCVIDDLGLRCWGDNTFAQGIVPADPADATQIVASHDHTCLLDGTAVRCWGNLRHYQTPRPTLTGHLFNPRSIATGFGHSCALDGDKIPCYAYNAEGPDDINNNGETLSPNDSLAPHNLRAGRSHACMIDQNEIRCWGSNRQGQTSVPSGIQAPRELALGRAHTCAIDGDHVLCWGNNDYGQLNAPKDLIHPEQMASGENHVCLIDVGRVRCWGDNRSRQADPPSDLALPVAVAAGESHSCALLESGIRCWGDASLSQLDVPRGFTLSHLGYVSFSPDSLESSISLISRYAYPAKARLLRDVARTLLSDVPTSSVRERAFVMNALKEVFESLQTQRFTETYTPRFDQALREVNNKLGVQGLLSFDSTLPLRMLALKILAATLMSAKTSLADPALLDKVQSLLSGVGNAISEGGNPSSIQKLLAQIQSGSETLDALVLNPDSRPFGRLVFALSGFLEKRL